MSALIHLDEIRYTYKADSENPIHAVNGVTLHVEQGEYVVILGHNGSGKSTLAKHLNGLLLPTEGDVWVREWNTKKRTDLRSIRSTVGMVFQTPDNQIVATIVEEDVAFGPENLGVPYDEIIERVDTSLQLVEMEEFRHRAPHLLSGGQKQRICIAGMLAMRPEVLVLDESTAMLDPSGRKEVLDIVRRLNKDEGKTIIAITHFMEEAVWADRLVVMEAGKIALMGTPREVFAQSERLRELQIDVPQVTQLALALHDQNPSFPKDVLTTDELVAAVQKHGLSIGDMSDMNSGASLLKDDSTVHEPIIELQSIAHNYMHDTPLEVQAISGVSLAVRAGEILGVIGHTGSGKSTIIQHLNALLRPHEGHAFILGQDSADPKTDVLEIRRRVGLVFQHPEAQLFEQYVGDDIAYGPRNLKLDKETIRERVRSAMVAVGLGFEDFKDRMTFGLSGGQMRRVAVAGVLALEPEVLVLDEPTAGLDPQGRIQLLDHILALHRDAGMTLIMISHNMEELAQICDRICVVEEGTIAMIDTPDAVFSQVERLREMGLGIPPVTEAVNQLVGQTENPRIALTVADAANLLGGMFNNSI